MSEKKLRRILAFMCLTAMVTSSGCDKEDKPGNQMQTNDGAHVSTGFDDLDFDLSKDNEDQPEFEDAFLESDNSSASSENASDAEPMYIERDGYAYQIDPATLDVIDVPLDPITHEPVLETGDIDVELPEVPPAPGYDVSESIIDKEENNQEQTVDTPSAETPTEDTKYPNTGIFLEDD